jgi:HAD superfamily hydrolase (TIGR01509 family)
VDGLLFDVDGTLLDTNYLHVLAWSRAFRERGRDVSMASIHALIGMGSDKLIDRLAGGEHPDLDEGHSRHYQELQGEMRALDGAAELLRACHDGGARVVLATSAKGEEVDPMLDAIGARDAVDVVVSSADVEHSKPDPDIFVSALRRAGLQASQSVVVGDTVWDIEAARRCGLGCVCVTTGGIAREVLTQSGALAVYESVRELCDQLERSPLAGYLPRRAGV